MTDCPNGEIRDLLPDLLHGRLGTVERARVEQHVESCADCAAELALLRDLRGAIRRAPVIDTAAIVAAIPSYRAPVRRSWGSWRAAAAIAAVAIGGTSIALVNRERPDALSSPPMAVAPGESMHAPAPSSSMPSSPERTDTTRPVAQPKIPATVPAEPVGLAMAGGAVGELSDREITTLLDEIETLDALPSEDVESSSSITGSIPLESTR